MKLKKIAQVISLLCIAGTAGAQATPEPSKAPDAKPQSVERITVTGSSIKRVQDESAQVLQIITKEEIERAGITSAEQLLATISANGTGADNLSSNTGIQLGTTDRNNQGR